MNLDVLNYNLVCQNCLQGAGINNIYLFKDFEVNTKTDSTRESYEFDGINILKKELKRTKVTCDFCGYPNSAFDIYNLSVNDEALYCKPEIEVPQLHISMIKNGGIEAEFKPQGKTTFLALRTLLRLSLKIVKYYPESDYVRHRTGKVEIITYMKPDGTSKANLYRFCGLGRAEISDILKEFWDKLNADFENRVHSS